MSRSEEHTSELQSRFDLVCRLLLEKKKRTSCKERSRHFRGAPPMDCMLLVRLVIRLPCALLVFSFQSYHHYRDLHSFPTRRSSDLWIKAKPIAMIIAAKVKEFFQDIVVRFGVPNRIITESDHNV